MIEIEELRQRLAPYNLTRVAEQSGVDKHTLYRLMNERSRPTYETVRKLIKWMEGVDDDANA